MALCCIAFYGIVVVLCLAVLLRCVVLHCAVLHCAVLYCVLLHCVAWHCVILQYIPRSPILTCDAHCTMPFLFRPWPWLPGTPHSSSPGVRKHLPRARRHNGTLSSAMVAKESGRGTCMSAVRTSKIGT